MSVITAQFDDHQAFDARFAVAECERCGARWLIETDGEWRLEKWLKESDVGWDLVRDPCPDCPVNSKQKVLTFRVPTKTEVQTLILDEKVPRLPYQYRV